jgi:hypothetical protein
MVATIPRLLLCITSVLMILCLATFPCHAALDTGEVTALSQILDSFPNLATVSAWDRYSGDAIYEDYGGPWSYLSSNICPSEGFSLFYGLICSPSGHIAGIRLYVPLYPTFLLIPALLMLTLIILSHSCLS